MSTTYCTSCGAETSKHICKNCGVKQDQVHKYCKYCGQPLPEKAHICVNCNEKVKGDSFFWTLLNLVCAIVPLSLLVLSVDEGQPALVIGLFALSFLLCLPLARKLINKCTIGKRKVRALLKLARIVLAVALLALGLNLVMNAEPEELTAEDAYEQIIYCAQQGHYLEAWQISVNCPAVTEYLDAEAYLTYCEAMRAYEAGGIGYASEQLRTVPEILDAREYIAHLENEIGSLNGVYVEDNGVGSYLYLVIEDGKVFTEVVPYGEYTGEYHYDLSQEHCDYIVRGQYDSGEAYYAIGRYSTVGAEVTVAYVMNIFEDNGDIMLIVPEGAQFNTFNGLYEKIQ